MNLGYDKVTEYSTNDLPLVMTSLDIIFGFRTSPNYQTIIDLQQLTSQGGDDKELIRLAAQSLVYVQTPDGEKFDLTTIEAVEILVNETDIEFIRGVIVSWFVLTFAKIERDKKKLTKSLEPFTANGTSPSPAGELSNS